MKKSINAYSVDLDLFKWFVRYLMNLTGQTFSKTSITNYLKKNEKNYITISIFTEFLQEALFSMKFKCKDLIGKKEVDFFFM